MGGLSVEAATLGLGALFMATIVATIVARRQVIRSGAPPADDLTLYQLALLAGGPQRVSDTALAYLTWSGAIEVRESTDRLVRLANGEVDGIHPVEASILAAIDAAGVRPEGAMLAGREAARRHVTGLEGLRPSRRSRVVLSAGVVIGCASVAAGATWWMLAGPRSTTGFVPLLGLMAFLYGLWWFLAGAPKVSGSGRMVLESRRRLYDDDLQVAAIGITSLPVSRAMGVIALYGRDALTGGLSGLRKVMTGSPAPTVVMRSSLIAR